MDKRITVDFTFKTVFTVIFALVLAFLLYYLRDILILFLLALILATALKPAVDFFEKRKVPRWVSILGFYAAIGLTFYMLIRLIIPPISTQVTQLIENRQILAERATVYFERAPFQLKELITDFTNTLPERVAKYTSGSVVGNVLGVFSGLLGFFTVFVVTFYLLLSRHSLEEIVEENWFWGSKEKAKRIFKKISLKVSLWVRGQLILSTAVGLLTYIGLTVLGVEFALTLALIAAVTELLPVIGPYIGAAPAVLIAFVESPILALWVALLYFGIQQFESSILVPQVMKKALGISSVTIIFALLVGAKLLGILGVVIAVPVASAITVIIEELKKKE